MRHTAAFTLALLTACSCTVANAADIGFQKSLTASGPVALNLCANSGAIQISGVDGNKVEVSAKIHKSNWHAFGNADEMKHVAANPPIHQTGNTLQIGDNTTCGSNVIDNIAIDYDISIPKTSSVAAKLGAGTIHITAVGGAVHAAIGSGDIVATGPGPNSRIATGNGTVDIQDAHGALMAETGNGNISLRDSNGTDARLATTSGTITATNIKGALTASTLNGNLFIGGTPTSNWKMRTSNGSIHFEAPAGTKFSLDAETGSGTIDSSLPAPVSGHVTNGMLSGPVNGGGPEVKMYTGSGSIDLK